MGNALAAEQQRCAKVEAVVAGMGWTGRGDRARRDVIHAAPRTTHHEIRITSSTVGRHCPFTSSVAVYSFATSVAMLTARVAERAPWHGLNPMSRWAVKPCARRPIDARAIAAVMSSLGMCPS